jgi:peptidoglycan hydrolase CwlO-like protein
MIDRILSFVFISIIVVLIITSYLEVPAVESMKNNDSRELGKVEERVNNLTKKVNDLLSVVKGTNMEKISQYKTLNKMHSQVNTNKENIDKLANNSPEATVANSSQ